MREDAFNLGSQIKGISNKNNQADWDSYKEFMPPHILKPNISQPAEEKNKAKSASPNKKNCEILDKTEKNSINEKYLYENDLHDDVCKFPEQHHSRQKSSPLISSGTFRNKNNFYNQSNDEFRPNEILENYQNNYFKPKEEFKNQDQQFKNTEIEQTLEKKEKIGKEMTSSDNNDISNFFENQKKLRESMKLKTQESKLYMSNSQKKGTFQAIDQQNELNKRMSYDIKFVESEHGYAFPKEKNNNENKISNNNNNFTEITKKYEECNLLDFGKSNSKIYIKEDLTAILQKNNQNGFMPNLLEINFNQTISGDKSEEKISRSLIDKQCETIQENEKENLENHNKQKTVFII